MFCAFVAHNPLNNCFIFVLNLTLFILKKKIQRVILSSQHSLIIFICIPFMQSFAITPACPVSLCSFPTLRSLFSAQQNLELSCIFKLQLFCVSEYVCMCVFYLLFLLFLLLPAALCVLTTIITIITVFLPT